MAALVDEWYEERKGQPPYSLGAVCVAPSPYLVSDIYAVRCDHYDPADPGSAYYSVTPISTRVLGKTPTAFHQHPHHALGLHKDEELMVAKAKLRPVVILSAEMDLRQAGLGSLLRKRIEECFVCAPIYSIYGPRGESKLAADFVDRMRRLEWPYFFPLPESKEFGRKESFLRFDRLSVISKGNLDGTRTWVSEDGMLFVLSWLWYYLTGEMDEMARGLREELRSV